MRSVIIFAGAGASKAVNPKEYPTTVEFFDGLPDDIKTATLFTLALKYLRRHGRDIVVDIEQVLWVLQELKSFLDSIRDTDTVSGWFLHNNRFGGSIGANLNYQQLFDAAPKVESRLTDLIDAVDRRVYDLYAREPQPAELEANWLPLLRALLPVSERLEVFTTNYDINIEVALDILARDAKLPQIDTGRRGAIQRHLDERVWSAAPSRSERVVGLLTKLHGSVDWGRGPSKIYVGDPLFKGTHDKHVIVYPGFKGVPQSEPFNTFHNHLAASVSTATHLVFIGFAFRDEYINGILERLTSPSARVIIVNPNDTPDQPYVSERVIHVRDFFTAESATKVMQAVARPSKDAGA